MLRVLVVGPAAASPLSRGGMATVVALMAAHPDPALHVTVVPTYVDGPRVRRLAVGLKGMAKAAWLASRRADVVHVHLSHGGSVIRKALPLWAARCAGIPSVVHGHSFDFGGWFDGLTVMAQRLVRVALTSDLWLVLGRRQADEYAVRLGLPSSRISVLYNGIRMPDRPVDQLGASCVHAVALGRLGDRKGSYDLVTAIGLLDANVRRRLRLTMAGDGEVDTVTAAVEAAGLGDTVRVAGWLSVRERNTLLSQGHVFVLPSREEGLPMALLEAMAFGLAPVTTLAGSIGEVITNGVNGLLVPPGRPDKIAEALTSLVLDHDRRARLGTAAHDTACAFTIDNWYRRLTAIWMELAGRTSPSAPPDPAH